MQNDLEVLLRFVMRMGQVVKEIFKENILSL